MNETASSVVHSPATVPSSETDAMRTPLTCNDAPLGKPSNAHHTAVKSPSKSNVRCSTTCSEPSVSTCAWISTFGME